MTPRALPDPPDYVSRAARAERARLWAQRLRIEREWELYEGDEQAYKTWHMMFASYTLAFFLKLTGLYERGLRNATTPVLRRLEWHPPRLPKALDGLTILHLSDFHFSRAERRFTEGDAACVAGVEADLLVITGDYRYGHFGPVEHVPHHLREVLQGLTIRGGMYATLGNHDLGMTAFDLQELGIEVLMNEGRRVNVRGEEIWIGGTDDAHFFKCASLDAALNGRPADAFTVLLSHTPELGIPASKAAVDLYFCGHTHGGQLCLPGGWPIKLNARSPMRLALGPWREGNTLGLTTHGLGTTDLPLRYNCPAEAHLITLRAE